jgi:hypothetical protein
MNDDKPLIDRSTKNFHVELGSKALGPVPKWNPKDLVLDSDAQYFEKYLAKKREP